RIRRRSARAGRRRPYSGRCRERAADPRTAAAVDRRMGRADPQPDPKHRRSNPSPLPRCRARRPATETRASANPPRSSRGDRGIPFRYSPAWRGRPIGIVTMGIVERTRAIAPSAPTDFNRFRLRRFVEGLGDELAIVREPTELADVAAILEGNPKAVLFRAVGRERQELVGNVTGSRARIARAFGVTPNELLSELLRRLRDKPEIIEVAPGEAPVREVVLTDEDADLTALPVHLGH